MSFRDRRSDEAPAPKPYTLVDLPMGSTIERRAPVGHEQARSDLFSGRLRIAIEALTPVHVASGLLELTGDARRPLMREIVRVDGVPVIPGSSFKGCVRAVVEAISASCVRVTRGSIDRQLQGCKYKEQLCVACRMFGAQDFQAPLRFSDMRLIDDVASAVEVVEVPQLFRPRPEAPLYLRGRSRGGRKFYMHGAQQVRGNTPQAACRAGSHFKGVIDFSNLTAAHLGLLLIALGQDSTYPLFLKLGGAKPACYGTIQVGVERLQLFNHERYLTWDAPEEAAVDTAPFLIDAHKIALRPQLDTLVETLRWPTDRECPSGIY